jgi:hypothetical protein
MKKQLKPQIENVSYTKSNNSLTETPTQLNDDELMVITGGRLCDRWIEILLGRCP